MYEYKFEHLHRAVELRILMDVVIIVSVSIMPLINTPTIAHFINDVETEELGNALTTQTSQLILELSKHLSAIMLCLLRVGLF